MFPRTFVYTPNTFGATRDVETLVFQRYKHIFYESIEDFNYFSTEHGSRIIAPNVLSRACLKK
jgi:hypothetical protein